MFEEVWFAIARVRRCDALATVGLRLTLRDGIAFARATPAGVVHWVGPALGFGHHHFVSKLYDRICFRFRLAHLNILLPQQSRSLFEALLL